jgi:hypothetical protein
MDLLRRKRMLFFVGHNEIVSNMATYHLYKWSIQGSFGPYSAPESIRPCLVGFRGEDAKRVITSHIVETNGREITTSSGSVYILEDIDPDYLKYLDASGRTYDPMNPIPMKKK